MTTQDHRAENTDSVTEAQSSSAGSESAPEGAVPSTEGAVPSTERTDGSTGGNDFTPQTESPTAGSEPAAEGAVPSAEESLFADDELSGLRVRWADVQATFVDDPRECVHKADGLVSEVVDQLTAGFSDARSRLESQWARGEQASTEELRVALKRYRVFFDRLLAV